MKQRETAIALAVSFAAVLPPVSPAAAQGFFDMLRRQGVSSYAPAEANPAAPVAAPLSITPTDINLGAVPRAGRKARALPPSPAVFPIEEDDHSDIVVEPDQPKRVQVALPPPRPGAVVRAAEEVAPVGQQRWAGAASELPPGLDAPGLPAAGGSQSVPAAPRLAALPATQSIPRWTLTDEAPLRPPGLRESEAPVANMPGVWAPPEANFQCLPTGIKQVLVDVAKRFGHVAILNAQRSRGTGARGSYHYQCRAVDFRVRGEAVMTVYNFLRAHPNVGGRKIYPMGFFHIDDGPVRSW